jgi:hypothetical protein
MKLDNAQQKGKTSRVMKQTVEGKKGEPIANDYFDKNNHLFKIWYKTNLSQKKF